MVEEENSGTFSENDDVSVVFFRAQPEVAAVDSTYIEVS